MKILLACQDRRRQLIAALALAAMAVAAVVGLALYAPQPALAGNTADVPAVSQVDWQPQLSAMDVSTATAASVATGYFSGSAVFGSSGGFLSVSGTARVTTTIDLTTSATLPVTVTVSGSIPLTVTEPLESIIVKNGDFASGFTQIYGTMSILDYEIRMNTPHQMIELVEDVPIAGQLGVNNINPPAVVTATGVGPMSGASQLVVVEQIPGRNVFMPVLFKSPAPPPGYYDDFSSYADGIWPQGDNGVCKVEYTGGHYRVKIRSGHNGYKCIVITRSPAFQLLGTIGVDARRISDIDNELWYGYYFSTGNDFNDQRWALEVRPDEKSCDGKDQPYFWLNWVDDDEGKNWYKCLKAGDEGLYIDEDEWNELRTERVPSNDLVKVYINDDKRLETTSSRLEDDGYFNLFVYSASSSEVVVEFDNFYAIP